MKKLDEKITSSKKFEKYKSYIKWLKYVINPYVIASVCFIIWMAFFDQNSLITHKELDKQIRELEADQKYFEQHLKNENAKLKLLQDNPAEIERIAREKFFLKKDNEDIFIIQQEVRKKPQNTTNE
ncbi:FtsB family cell division protein [Faecalibacter bovis]|uniref:Septum formation initiator family protein n=1 Tax=Faecalibacter bovis TaxID=2898187 RepID=A0ABX7XCX4_9FLAO|nr:septum formation initiator family protein [Faecalibacter bovis]MBS7333921.1 septum formation initiator family protein [Weeksellaceae bacterium]QTV05748.1 septum formation initiator family protein [Faecalibacter bovis]